MPTKATNFFNLIVKPTTEEFLNDIGNIRRGQLASIVLYHMADYWCDEMNRSSQRFKKNLSEIHPMLISQCPEFGYIRDIADATKHVELHQQKKIPRKLSLSDQITQPPGLFNAPFGSGGFNEASIVEFALDDGTKLQLDAAVRSVLSFWDRCINA